ncbi:hypothetical protein GGS20DRAFT_590676 [Poronia punctata]|nr:hypothetical protein GGS20DRAFT_590676 [Poronia punctata]
MLLERISSREISIGQYLGWIQIYDTSPSRRRNWDFIQNLDLNDANRSMQQDDFVADLDFATTIKALAHQPELDTTYVTGHENPDGDAIMSSVFEVTRRSVTYEQHCVAWEERNPICCWSAVGKDNHGEHLMFFYSKNLRMYISYGYLQLAQRTAHHGNDVGTSHLQDLL